MKRLLAVLFLLMMAFPVLAQDAPAWDVVVFEPTTGALYTVTAGGIKTGANLSDVLQFTSTSNYVLTPERDFLLFAANITNADGTGRSVVNVANTSSGACCYQLTDPAHPEMDGAVIGGLSPDGKQAVVLLFHMGTVYGGEGDTVSQVTTFDIATGAVTGSIAVNTLALPVAGIVETGVMFGGWKEDGIRLVASCIACEPAATGMYQIWNPATGALSDPVEAFDLSTQLLAATGEGIRAVQNQTFPFEQEQVTPYPMPNVVEYTPDATTPTSVIFFNPINLHISQAHWILDGQAVLVNYADPTNQTQASTEAYIVYRDGSWFPLDIPLNQAFLSGTPDGWMTIDLVAKTFVNYTVTGFKQVDVAEVDSYSADYVMLIQPAAMGAGITDKTFTPFPQP